MIYDCFLFNNELDVLDIRLHELSGVVDRFVLVESTVTHMNKQKPLYYEKNKERFREFEKKIIHVIVEDSPNVNNPWILNDFQFSQMTRGLKTAKPNDIILFGDLDEIPKKEKVKEYAKSVKGHAVFLEHLSYYFLNCMTEQAKWPGTQMMLYKDLQRLKTTWIAKYSPIDTRIPDAGWHFSYMGGVKAIQEKISSMAHQEFNTEKYNTPEKIKKAIYKQKDLFNHGIHFQIVELNRLPEYVYTHATAFSQLLLDPKKKIKEEQKLLLLLEIKHSLRIYYRKLRAHLQKY